MATRKSWTVVLADGETAEIFDSESDARAMYAKHPDARLYWWVDSLNGMGAGWTIVEGYKGG